MKIILFGLLVKAVELLACNWDGLFTDDGYSWIAFILSIPNILCSFIDVVFWGGSLDFIGLFDWFIFDTKDVFLNTGWILALIWTWRHEKKQKKSYSNEHNIEDVPFTIWFRNGCKLLPNTTSEYTRI